MIVQKNKFKLITTTWMALLIICTTQSSWAYTNGQCCSKTGGRPKNAKMYYCREDAGTLVWSTDSTAKEPFWEASYACTTQTRGMKCSEKGFEEKCLWGP